MQWPHAALLIPATLAASACLATGSHAAALASASPTTVAAANQAAGRSVFYGSSGRLQLAPPHVAQGPQIDGRLDDAVWSEAAVLDSFTHARPIEGIADTLGTTCLVMYDDQNLYIGFRVKDDPKLVQAPVVPRDQAWQGDWVGVSLDTYHDKQRSLFLCANPLGIQMDGVDREGGDSEMAPDFQYTSRGRLTDSGYEVEMAVPFKSLRFPNHHPITFGFNAIRDIKRNGAHLYWAPIRRDINSYHTQIGTLSDIQGVRPGRDIQLNPTVTGTQQGLRQPGGITYADPQSRFGVGFKVGLTSNIIADAAITPDFSQVEADAGVADVNERFAIFFNEKRPFFLEGSDFFSTPINLVYTRRIADPLYGVKLTGKAGRSTVGLLQASDRLAGGSIETLPDAANPYFDRDASFTIARFKRDVFQNSNVGVLLASRDHRDAHNQVAGIDGRLSWRDKYSLTFQGVQSWTRDPDLEGAISGLSPAEQAAVDPGLLGLRGDNRQGSAFEVAFSRDTRPLNTGFEVRGVTSSFDASMGFISRRDLLSFSGWVRPHIWSKGGQWYNAIHFPVFYQRIYDYGADRLTDETISTVVDVNLPMNTWIGAETVRRFIAFGGREFDNIRRAAIWAGSERFRTVRGGVTYVVGDQVVFAEAVPGHDRYMQVWSDLRFSSQLDGSFSLANRVVWREDDTRFAEALIPRLRLSYQFSKELALRWITELRARKAYDTDGVLVSDTRTMVPDVLLSYVLRPGTVVYLGYGAFLEGQNVEGLRPTQNSVFTKVSYLWQL